MQTTHTNVARITTDLCIRIECHISPWIPIQYIRYAAATHAHTSHRLDLFCLFFYFFFDRERKIKFLYPKRRRRRTTKKRRIKNGDEIHIFFWQIASNVAATLCLFGCFQHSKSNMYGANKQ